LVSLYVGNMLAVLYGFKGWIIVGAIIGSVILFSARAFRFFRH
jgi:hypothetical protein